LAVIKLRRELTASQNALPDVLHKHDMWKESLADMLLWIEQSYGLPELLSYNPNRRYKIRVIGNHNRKLIIISESIQQQVRGKIYIRSFFFCLDHTDET